VQRHRQTLRLTPISTAIPATVALRIYTESSSVDGKPLRSSGKAQHKPLDLLKALIAFGGRDVNTRILTEALWPDADGDAAQGAFDATLHRLRRLLGVDNAVQLKDGKLSLNENLCWVDAWTSAGVPAGGSNGRDRASRASPVSEIYAASTAVLHGVRGRSTVDAAVASGLFRRRVSQARCWRAATSGTRRSSCFSKRST
jgi:hypothetical protein